MNKGTKVRLIDGSYHMKARNGKIEHEFANIVSGREYEFIETGLKLPADNSLRVSMGLAPLSNDTILRDIKTNEIVFTLMRFVKEVKLEPVPVIKAIKAYYDGSTIRCEINGFTHVYSRSKGSDVRLKDITGDTIGAGEILNGTWYVEESHE